MVERGRTKCAQYWSVEPGKDYSVGGFTVTTLEVETNPDYTISKLLLANNKVLIEFLFYEYLSFSCCLLYSSRVDVTTSLFSSIYFLFLL